MAFPARRRLWAAIAVLLLATVLLAPGPSGAAEQGARLPEAAVQQAAQAILEAAPRARGVCLDVGCGSGQLMLELAKRSEFFIHGLEADEKRVAAAREALAASGLYGSRVAVEKANLGRLPYGDYCINLIVRGDMLVDGNRGMSWKEVLRVLQPEHGVAFIGQSDEAAKLGRKLTADALRRQLRDAGIGDFKIVEKHGVWAAVRRARPAGMGDWSHGRRGSPTNNPCVADDLVKAPFHTLWIAGPRSFTKFGLPLASAGRVLLRHGGITHEGRWKPSTKGDLIQAFDSYNGTLLWQRRLDEPRGRGFVAVGDLVCAAAGQTLYAFDAADGNVRWKLAPEAVVQGMKDWSAYAYADGVVVAALYDQLLRPQELRDKRRRNALAGLSPADGKPLWKVRPEGGVGSFAIGEGLVFYTSPGRHLAAVDIRSGQQRWRQPAGNARALRYHQGRLYSEVGVFAAADGKRLGRAAGRGILVGARIVSGGFKGIRVTDLKTGKRLPGPEVIPDPFCPKTGIPRGSWCYGRCIGPTASTHCFFFTAGGTLIADLVRNEIFPCESSRSNCRTGVIAGNGVVYNSPTGCGCAFPVRGATALVPVDEAFYWARPESEPPPQLEKGPAYGEKTPAGDGGGDWPCYRHDPSRSNVTSAKVTRPLAQKWARRLAGRITPPAVAGGTVFVGSDNHAVYALGGENGRDRWRYRTGGEIWASPAHWRGRVYVGSQDGWVYCLRADNGKLVWRFRGGPHERKMIFFGRPQSLWPVGGGVIVDGGVAYFYAGYCSHDRVFVYALDAVTGEVVWVNDKAGRAVEVTGSEGGMSPYGVSPSGIIAASKDILYVPQGRRVPAAFRRSDGKLLWWNWRGDSKTRSSIEVQHVGGSDLALGGGLLFIGGRDRATGTNQAFTALDAASGRFWGADHPSLAKRAGRDEAGRAVVVKRAMWGTKPIRFGGEVAPVVIDGGVFVHGYRGGFFGLEKYLQTQFGPTPGQMGKWPRGAPAGMVVVAADQVVFVGAHSKQVSIVARADGRPVWQGKFKAQGAVLPNGLAVADGRLYVATRDSEVICLGK